MKKWIAGLLAVFLLLSLMACSQSDSVTDSSAVPAESSPANSPEASPENTTTPPASASNVYDGSMPICNEPTEFSIWLSYDFGESGISDLNESPAWQQLENLSNVHIRWETVSASAATEQFNLMFVSESYTDGIVTTTTSYKGGLASYIEEEILYDLRELLETNAPNYSAIRESDEGIYRDTMLDNGSVAGFHRILASSQPTWLGMVVREDLLQQLNLEDPVTVADYTEVLTAFRDAGVEAPLGTWNDGLDPVWLASYGLTGSIIQGLTWIHDGDIACYPMARDEFRDYLTQMNAWYSAGLVDSEFYVSTGTMFSRMEEIATGFTGMYSGLAPLMSVPHFLSQIEGFSLKALPNPVVNEGDTRIVTQCAGVSTRVEDSILTISTACTQPELLIRWMDYFYCEEGMMLANYGIQDETYTLDENGQPVYTSIIAANPDGLGKVDASIKYAIYNAVPFLYDWTNQLADMLPCAMRVYEEGIWEANWEDARTMPALTLTADESEAVGSVMGDIATYVGEMTIKFIIGEEPLENFDAYVEHLYSMGLQSAADAYTAAYSRYTHRQ